MRTINWSFVDPYTAGLRGNFVIGKGYYWIDNEINLTYFGQPQNRKIGHFSDLIDAMEAAEKDILETHLELIDAKLED